MEIRRAQKYMWIDSTPRPTEGLIMSWDSHLSSLQQMKIILKNKNNKKNSLPE